MGMVRPSKKCKPGEIKPTDCFVVPPSTVEEVVTQSVDVITPGELLDRQDYVQDTIAAGKTTDANSDLVKAISAYSAYGTNITVTFYHALNADTQQRTWSTDFSYTLDNVHYSYLKIKNFQMKLMDSVSFDYTTQEVKSQVTGQALLYPYFCPNQGDLFIYQVQDKVGLFRITEAPKRMSINQSTTHTINFILMSFLTPQQLAKLNACVSDTATFSLDRYMNDNGALLTSGEDELLTNATKAVSILTNAYCSEFYDDRIFGTFIESACLYDPYIVEFITKVIPVSRMPGYPTQLKSDPVQWRRSFWFKLLDPATVPDSLLISKCFKVLQEIHYRTVGINALANRCYIAIDKKGRHPYPPFRIPTEYNNNTTTLPMQVRLYFDEGRVRPAILLDLADKILLSNRRARFYYIPIIIFLLQKLIDAINTGADIIYNEDIIPDDEGDCMSGCLNCIYNCNPIPNEHKICPGAVECECHHHSCYIPSDGGSVDEDSCHHCQHCDHDISDSALDNV